MGGRHKPAVSIVWEDEEMAEDHDEDSWTSDDFDLEPDMPVVDPDNESTSTDVEEQTDNQQMETIYGSDSECEL